MPHDWIIEVLDDLRTYARENRLDKLAKELAETRLVALTEIASAEARSRAATDAPTASAPHSPYPVRGTSNTS